MVKIRRTSGGLMEKKVLQDEEARQVRHWKGLLDNASGIEGRKAVLISLIKAGRSEEVSVGVIRKVVGTGKYARELDLAYGRFLRGGNPKEVRKNSTRTSTMTPAALRKWYSGLTPGQKESFKEQLEVRKAAAGLFGRGYSQKLLETARKLNPRRNSEPKIESDERLGNDKFSLPKGIHDLPENRRIRWQKTGKYYTNSDAVTLYHGTTEDRLDAILEQGLRYGNLTPSKVEAENIAKIRRKGEKPIVLEVYVPPNHIYPVFHGPKSISTDALAIAIPIEPKNIRVARLLGKGYSQGLPETAKKLNPRQAMEQGGFARMGGEVGKSGRRIPEIASWITRRGQFIDAGDSHEDSARALLKRLDLYGDEATAEFMQNTGTIRFIVLDDEACVDIRGPVTAQQITAITRAVKGKELIYDIWKDAQATKLLASRGGVAGVTIADLKSDLQAAGYLPSTSTSTKPAAPVAKRVPPLSNPIRRTLQGWFWGSRGPFASREKAVQVARAAYASGYRDNPTQTLTVTPHARTRMAQKGVTVPVLREAFRSGKFITWKQGAKPGRRIWEGDNGVMASVDGERIVTVFWRNPTLVSSSNPISLYESFHGNPPARQRKVSLPEPKGNLTSIGRLVALEYEPYPPSRHSTTRFRHEMGDTGEEVLKEKPVLASDQKGHLFIVPDKSRPKFGQRGIVG